MMETIDLIAGGIIVVIPLVIFVASILDWLEIKQGSSVQQETEKKFKEMQNETEREMWKIYLSK